MRVFFAGIMDRIMNYLAQVTCEKNRPSRAVLAFYLLFELLNELGLAGFRPCPPAGRAAVCRAAAGAGRPCAADRTAAGYLLHRASPLMLYNSIKVARLQGRRAGRVSGSGLPDDRGLSIGFHLHRAFCDCRAQGEQRGKDQDAHAVILPSAARDRSTR